MRIIKQKANARLHGGKLEMDYIAKDKDGNFQRDLTATQAQQLLHFRNQVTALGQRFKPLRRGELDEGEERDILIELDRLKVLHGELAKQGIDVTEVHQELVTEFKSILDEKVRTGYWPEERLARWGKRMKEAGKDAFAALLLSTPVTLTVGLGLLGAHFSSGLGMMGVFCGFCGSLLSLVFGEDIWKERIIEPLGKTLRKKERARF